MFTARRKRAALGAAMLFSAALAVTACSSGNPLDEASEPAEGGSSDAIVISSQGYYSNEIIAEIYAQALEGAGHTVERQFSVGERDAILPDLESGAVQLTPEYTGNLLQFYDPETTARTADDVYAALEEALPDGLTVLDQASATDQDSYTVTAAFAKEYGLTTIADLANVTVPLVLGGPPELEERPYGPTGLAETYGVEVSETRGTGQTTLEELLAGSVNVANIFTADPAIETEDLQVLEDPEGLFLASNVVPLVNADIAEEIADTINAVSAALTPEGLVALNVQSTVDQMSSEDIAAEWLAANDLG